MKRSLGMNARKVNDGTSPDERGIAMPFETEWPNGCMDEENFCTDVVKQMRG